MEAASGANCVKRLEQPSQCHTSNNSLLTVWSFTANTGWMASLPQKGQIVWLMKLLLLIILLEQLKPDAKKRDYA